MQKSKPSLLVKQQMAAGARRKGTLQQNAFESRNKNISSSKEAVRNSSSSLVRQRNQGGGMAVSRTQNYLAIASNSKQPAFQIGLQKMKLIPDRTTSQMISNKSVKFVDPADSFIPVRPVDAQLGAEFIKKQERSKLDKSLQKVINKTKIAHRQIMKHNREEQERKNKLKKEIIQPLSPLAKMATASIFVKNDDQDILAELADKNEKIADGFVRSRRTTELRVKDELRANVANLEEEKTNLIQKMNKALIQLDKVNEVKRELGEKLLEQIKFVRDLQIAASKGDDISYIISDQLKIDFQREKEMSDRLKEELVKSEQERLHILNRIKHISNAKELSLNQRSQAELVTVGLNGIEDESKTNQLRRYRVSEVDLQRVHEDLYSKEQSMAANEIIVEETRKQCRDIEDEIEVKQGQLDLVRHDFDNLSHELQILENKYRDTIYLHEGAREGLDGMHRMHVKLLASRQIKEAIDKALTRLKKDCVDQTLWVTRGYVNQFGAIYRLRNIMRHNDKHVAKKAIARWFKLACDPMMLIEQNRRMPIFFARGHRKREDFDKVSQQVWLTESIRNHQNSQLDVMKGCINSFWRRELRLRFTMWRDNVKTCKQSLKVIERAFTKMLYFDKARAFTKWNSFALQQDYQARIHGTALLFAAMQTKAIVFHGWRRWADARKSRNDALKRRVIRQLRVAVQRRQHLAKMALSTLGFEIQKKSNLLSICFNALKYNKEDEKLQFVTDKLSQSTQPKCQNLRNNMFEISTKHNVQQKQRATVAFMTMFGRQLSQAFHKWKRCALYKTVELDVKLKIRLIKLFRSKLTAAFNLWRVNRGASAIELQVMEIENLQSQNKEIEETTRQNDIQIKAADRSSKSMGAKHLKKLVAGAFLKHTKQYFDRWRRKNSHINAQKDGSKLILSKIRTRFLRMAWNKYRFGMMQTEKEAKNENRLEDVQIRLNYRQKKRIFSAIKGFNKRNVTARRWLKTLISGRQHDNLDTAFRRWKDFNDNETSLKWQEEVSSLKQTSEQLNHEIGVKSEKLTRSMDKSSRVKDSYEKSCQQTLKKYAARLLNNKLQRAFRTWKNAKINLTGREVLLTSIRRQILSNTLRQAMIRWRNASSIQQIQMTMEEITNMETNVSIEEAKSKQATSHHKRAADKCVQRMREVDNETQKQQKLYENAVKKLTAQNQTNFFQTKFSHIFNGWRTYTQRRKRCCQILSSALRKTSLQRTFTTINQFQRSKNFSTRKEDTSKRMLRTYQKFRLKAAMTKWREFEFQKTVMLIDEANMEFGQQGDDFVIHRQNIKKHHAAVMNSRNKNRTLVDWISAWQAYASEERDTKMRTKNLTELLGAKNSKKALQKWKMRTRKTLQMRAFLKRSKLANSMVTLKSLFKAWKGRKNMDKNFGHRLTVLLQGIRNVNTRQSFDLIKRYALIKQMRGNKHRSAAMKKVQRCLANHSEFKLRAYFDKMLQWRDRCRTRDARMRAALNNVSTARLRCAFLKWKHKSNQITVYLQNEDEDGPCNLEAWQLRQDNFNLIKLLKDEGQSTKDIALIHQKAEKDYKAGVEKSLCRMLCYQQSEEGLYLLPACLDQWKKFTKLRKIWRRFIKEAEIKLKDDILAAKMRAFKKMKFGYQERQQVLLGIPLAQLKKQCVNNIEKLDRLADYLEDSGAKIGDLTEQREMLLNGKVSGQKLAFALSIANQQHIKMAAMSKFLDFGSKQLSSNIEQAIKTNLDRIADLKSKIAQNEQDNDQLASQNDQFRRGALDGISMAHHVQALTSERDKMSVELADKAHTIRKLLEDNQFLQSKLSEANLQHQEQNLSHLASAGMLHSQVK